MELASGAKVGGYEILEPLGRGGQSQVYKALDLALKRVVALKLLSERFVGDEIARRRLLLEARTLSTFSHPGIATVFQIGEIDGTPYIAMEYVEGQTLQSRLREGMLTAAEALRLLVEITEAVGYAHGKGVLHRDLKPGNVVVTPEGHAKLLDFGLAKLTSESLRERMSVADEVTSAGSMVGTVSYVSPEQARGEELDAPSDLWALGVILYEMLS
ncbi:MAG: serine/threonine-protein kinase, partial [Acidobacteriota bacterium]